MDDFALAWELFHDAWLTALIVAALMPLCGIVLVLRNQVFLSAAVGQTATLGIAAGLWLGLGATSMPDSSHAETMTLVLAMLAGCVTAVTAMRALTRSGTGLEARSVALFLAGSSLSVLLTAKQPHGLEEVKRLTLSSLLGASELDVGLASAMLLVSLLAALRWRDHILLWAMDPVTAQAHGSSAVRYDIAVGTWIGICTGFAIHATGLLFAFGVTVLPVLVARSLASSLRGVLWLAPLLGVATTAASLLIAHVEDLPPGQVAVGVSVLMLPLAAALRGLRASAARS